MPTASTLAACSASDSVAIALGSGSNSTTSTAAVMPNVFNNIRQKRFLKTLERDNLNFSGVIALWSGLIPFYAVVERRAFVVFEVLQNRRFHGDMEVVGFVRSYRHETCAHSEAVHIARDVAVHVSQFVGVEVVGCGEPEIPPLRRPYVARETEVLGDFPLVFEFFLVEIAITVGDGVVHRQIPRDRPFLVAVGIENGSRFGVLVVVVGARAEIGVGHIARGFFGEVADVGLFIVFFAFECVVVECVGEGCACR